MDTRIEVAVSRAFDLGEVGLQVAAYLGDQLIVDVSAGTADEQTGQKVTWDTLFAVFSVSKAFTATAIQVLAERGLLDLDSPVATYWPEYARHGKGGITIRHVLTHRAGVPHMPPDLIPEGLQDWDGIVGYLADVEPLHRPNERPIYHSISFGYILGEVARRVDPEHRSICRFVRDELCVPFGIDDLWLGALPEAQESRMAKLTLGRTGPEAAGPDVDPKRAVSMPAGIATTPSVWNRREFRAACIPAGSAVMTARAGARFFGILANGGALDGREALSRSRLLELTKPRDHSDQIDETLGMNPPIGIGGLHLGGPHPYSHPAIGNGVHILAHGGAGGSIGWADLDNKLSVMICHNRMFSHDVPREKHPFVALGDAIRAVAAERTAAERMAPHPV